MRNIRRAKREVREARNGSGCEKNDMMRAVLRYQVIVM